MCLGSGFEFRCPAMASTNDGATEVENCLRGRKRHNPVSSIQVRASSRVKAPLPFKRIRSARDASNCSAVKEKPRFQAGDPAFSAIYSSPESSFGCRHFSGKPGSECGNPSEDTLRRLDSTAYAFLTNSDECQAPGCPHS